MTTPIKTVLPYMGRSEADNVRWKDPTHYTVLEAAFTTLRRREPKPKHPSKITRVEDLFDKHEGIRRGLE
jgi:hypothetical protein